MATPGNHQGLFIEREEYLDHKIFESVWLRRFNVRPLPLSWMISRTVFAQKPSDGTNHHVWLVVRLLSSLPVALSIETLAIFPKILIASKVCPASVIFSVP